MHLYTNSIDNETVREETRNGRDYLVAEVTVARPLSLNGGYVSDETLAETVPDWNDINLPIGHPVDAFGNYISAKLPEVIDNAVTGELYYSNYDFEERDLEGELWVDVERTEDLGHYGERIIEILEDGEELEVSSAYRGEEGEPGVYEGIDGKAFRDEVRINLRPDHVALLPDELGPGKCSCEDGCGVESSDGIDDTPENAEPMVNSVGVSGHTPSSSGPTGIPGAGYCIQGSAKSADRVFVNMVNDEDNDGDESSSSTSSTSAARTSDESNEMIPNQSDGDRVRWSGTDDNTRYGIVVSEDDSENDVPDGEHLIAVYEQTSTDDDDDSVEWTATDETVTVGEDTLTTIEEFPAEPATNTNSDPGDSDGAAAGGDDGGGVDANDASPDDPAVHANIVSEPRVPKYEGTVTAEESEDEFLWWGINDYLDGWTEATGEEYHGDPYSALSSIPDDSRDWIAEHTLLGSPDAESEDNLLMFDVVGPDDHLYEERLDDILGPIGARATIPEEQRAAARTVARDLLEEEFGRTFEDDSSTSTNAGYRAAAQDIISKIPGLRVISTTNGEETTPDHDDCGCGETSQNDCECGHGSTDGTISNRTMSPEELTDDDYAQLAANTNWSVAQLKKMSGTDLEPLYNLVQNAEEGESGDDDGTDDGGDGTDTGDDGGSDDDTTSDDDVDANEDIPEPIANKFAEMQRTIDDQQETIEEYRTNRNSREQNHRDGLKSDIKEITNAYSDDELEEMNTTHLESTREFAIRAANASTDTGTDFGALDRPYDVTMESNEEEDDSGTEYGGSFGDFRNAKEETAD